MFEKKLSLKETPKQEGAEMTVGQEAAKKLKEKNRSYLKNLGLVAAALAMLSPLFPAKGAEAVSPKGKAQKLELDPAIRTAGKNFAEQINQRLQKEGYNIEVSISQQEIITVESEEKIKEAYEKAYQEAMSSKTPYAEFSFQTADGQAIELGDFSEQIGIKISPEMMESFKQEDFRIVFCYNKNSSAVDKGLILNTKRSGKIKTPDQFKAEFDKWEPAMINDLKNIFYPDSILEKVYQFEEVPHKDKHGFMPGLTRQEVSFQDAGGKKLYFGRVYFDERLIMANSPDCLQQITDKYSPESG